MTIVIGALVTGQPLRRDPTDVLTRTVLVEPFLGLPPEGAPASTPETGTLILQFGARIGHLGGDVHFLWLYADGRLIWKRNLEGTLTPGVFGTNEPTTAVIEQRLTPEGAEFAAVGGHGEACPERDEWFARFGPGVVWGGLRVRAGGRLLDASWSDGRLPARLADPGSWLPASAWADRRIGGYVASRYAVWPIQQSSWCRPDLVEAPLASRREVAPGPTRPAASGPAASSQGTACYAGRPSIRRGRFVTRSTTRASSWAGIRIGGLIDEGTTPGDNGATPWTISVESVPVLPNGEPVPYGG